MASLQRIDQVDVKGKVILLRVDLNVPVHNEKITDVSRIESHQETVQYLIKNGARVLLLSHFKRPTDGFEARYSLKPMLPTLRDYFSPHIRFHPIDESLPMHVKAMKEGDITCLENIRFHQGELENNPEFAKSLAQVADFYVNDALSVSHRAHASVVGIPDLLPHAAGFALSKELEALENVMHDPKRPIMAIVAGSKISTKLKVLHNLIKKVDTLAIGGGIANTLLHAKGHDVGWSLVEKDLKEEAIKIMEAAENNECQLLLPSDVRICQEVSPTASVHLVDIHHVPSDYKILDIGHESAKNICDHIKGARTLIWNGPLGLYENPPFNHGTNVVAQCVKHFTEQGNLYSVVGGGETVAALRQEKVLESMSFVSMAGGAFLEYLEGRELPGIKALFTNE